MKKYDSKVLPYSDDVVEELLHGAIEMHVHGSPDILPRKMSDLGVARVYKTAGLKGVLLKCHITATTSIAAIVGEAIGDFHVFGGLALNKMVGGLNPTAVETELRLGAKEIWMPTISAVNHIKLFKGNLAAAVPLTDESGAIRPELYEILDLIAQKDAILGTGHLTSEECEKVVALAQTRGVKRIIITHPEFECPNMSVEVQKKLARQGVLFERCFYASNSPQKLLPKIMAQQIKEVGADVSIMATDFGQDFNEEPLVGFRRYIRTMLDFGISPEEIEKMVKYNPAQIMGI